MDCRPNVEFLCDVDEDPFLFMEDNDKVYGERGSLPFLFDILLTAISQGFTISLKEWPKTITTLWSTVKGKLLIA